jgi:cardiolipin synthase
VPDLTVLGVLHAALGLFLSFDVVLHKHKPVSAVLWLGILWVVPYVGALSYLMFGMDRVGRGAAAREAARAVLKRRARVHPTFERMAVDTSHVDAHAAGYIFRATDPAVRPFRVLRGNRAELMVDGDEFYPALFEAISGATSSVHVQTFIISRDNTGRELLERLAERARAGVEVRLLYDRFGSFAAHVLRFFEPARQAGVQMHSISQANPFKGRFQINLRNHRKLAVIDGDLGFVGGINFDDKNLSTYTGGSPDRDYHVRLQGPAVSDLQFQFVEDWHFASSDPPDAMLDSRYFPELDPVGEALVQIVPGGPEILGRGLANAFFAAIVAAERTITILTPYFVPDQPIIHAMRYAAQRGVSIRLVVPERNNHWYTGFAARALYTPLLVEGVRVFERRPPFAHAKALVVDGVYAMLGSANLDYRSLYLNYELNIEVADLEFVARVEEQLESEIEQSREVSLEAHLARPFPRRLAENFCHLFQPVL